LGIERIGNAMKIGKIDVSIKMLVYAGAFVASLIFLSQLWFSKDDIRKEAFFRSKIMRATYDVNGEGISTAIDSCKMILASHPNKIGVKLFLGNLLIRQPNAREAKTVFEEIAASTAASNQEKSWALVGSGVANFIAAAKEDKLKAAKESEAKFLQALDLEKSNNTDALANMALIQMYKTPPNIDLAEKYCKLALDAKTPPSIKVQEQLYGLNGVILTKRGKPVEAIQSYDQAHVINPAAKSGEEARRIATVLSCIDKKLEPPARKEMCRKAENEVKNFTIKDMKITVINAVGIGWSMLKGTPDFMDSSYPAAVARFKQAMDEDPKDARAYGNTHRLLEDRIADLVGELKGNVTGLKGETPKINVWKALPTDKLTRYPVEDNPKLSEIRKHLQSEELLWQKFLEKNTTASNEQKIDAKLRQLACSRRLTFLLDINEEPLRPNLYNKSNKLIEDMLKVDLQNPAVYFAKGEVLLEQDKYMDAFKAFDQAAKLFAEKKIQPPAELARLLAELGKKPELISRWPKEGERWFGAKPVIGCNVLARTNAGPLKAEMKLGDKTVQPTVSGTQVLYCPADSEISDGNQTVTIKITDAMGQILELEPFSFYLDRKPPNLTIVPEGGSVVPLKATWTIKLNDPAGVDPSTVTVTIKSVKSAAPATVLVKAGLTKGGAISGLIKPQEFELSRELMAGEYVMEITAQDGAGNVLSQSLKYQIKGGVIKEK